MLYFLLASLPLLVDACEEWSKQPPTNSYAILTVFGASLVAGLVSVRAYLDQHLSASKEKDKAENTAPVVTTPPAK